MSDEPTSIRWAATGAALPLSSSSNVATDVCKEDADLDLRATDRSTLEAGGAHVRFLRDWPKPASLKTRPGRANAKLAARRPRDEPHDAAHAVRPRARHQLGQREGLLLLIPHMPMAW
jgi:hypothetical protein